LKQRQLAFLGTIVGTLVHQHNVWLISVPTGRFVVAVASLSHR